MYGIRLLTQCGKPVAWYDATGLWLPGDVAQYPLGTLEEVQQVIDEESERLSAHYAFLIVKPTAERAGGM